MSQAPHVLMLFLDGVGIGRDDAGSNPFFAARMAALRGLLGGWMPHLGDARRELPDVSLLPLDATLGVAGLPQSGTGQAALLTGQNAARRIGKHFGPYPYSTLRPLLEKENIFSMLRASGRTGFYANAFPEAYFEHLRHRKGRMTAIPLSWTLAGNALNGSDELAAGRALSADITNERWHGLGHPGMPVITSREAGKRLNALAQVYDFVLYELYMTDHAGHSRSMDESIRVLGMIDDLLGGLVESFDGDSTVLLLTSDHGNIEDLSTKTHTRNLVPLLAAGSARHELTNGVTDITGVAPAILGLMH